MGSIEWSSSWKFLLKNLLKPWKMFHNLRHNLSHFLAHNQQICFKLFFNSNKKETSRKWLFLAEEWRVWSFVSHLYKEKSQNTHKAQINCSFPKDILLFMMTSTVIIKIFQPHSIIGTRGPTNQDKLCPAVHLEMMLVLAAVAGC